MTLGDFSDQADAYERARPGYPESLLDALITEAAIESGDSVVDFGAGTGIFTRMLVNRQFDVTAVEPNDDMFQRAKLPHVRWVRGTCEENSLTAGSQSWAVAAQAFHWADPSRALPQIHRVLKDGAFFTVIWNNRANRESEILEWTEDAIRRIVPEFDEAYRDRPWERILESTGNFAFHSRHVHCHSVAMSKPRYLELWRSHNRLNAIAGPGRFVRFLDELTEWLNETGIERIDVPYRCEAWSARRKD